MTEDLHSARRKDDRPSFAVVGDNTIDRYVGAGEAEFIGGNALNVAAQLGLAAERVVYFGAVGADPEAELIAGGLSRSGVSTSGLVVIPGETALTQIRLTRDGDRVFEREDFGVTAEYYPDAPALEELAAADWVHIGMLPRAGELRNELLARNPAVVISQDCAVSSGHDGLAVAFESVGEDALDAKSRATAALAAGARLAVITRGARGSVAYDGDTWWQQDALPTDVLDTTGAGDSFIAGFVASRCRGASVQQALLQGSAWASATCRHRGGYPQEAVR
ncbi:PfkB family carbohydrate kinase [Rathayibacter soli]|uniref:PfkB family carbohydrate kinase n=1 Tax=Rathayibacter soli TaxID=3144168 RepID=UPI0027E52BC5|nr:PfkB family carbohydrate kinase [Glaciibacter superstes]